MSCELNLSAIWLTGYTTPRRTPPLEVLAGGSRFTTPEHPLCPGHYFPRLLHTSVLRARLLISPLELGGHHHFGVWQSDHRR